MSNIRNYSKVPASNNSTPPNGWPEGTMFLSQVNDTARQQMADHRTQWEDAEWFDWGDTGTYVSATSFTVATDLTSRYLVNRRIKATGTTPFTVFGTISSSSYGAPNTTVVVTWDSGSLDATLSNLFLSHHSPTNDSLPRIIPLLSTTNAFTGSNSFIDNNTTIIGSSDATKKVRLEVDGLTTATTRTITVPDRSLTLHDLSPITASLGADVLLNNTANYFDGPSVAQGTAGTWFVSGTITLYDTAIAAMTAKLWDGVTVISSGLTSIYVGNLQTTISLSGFITSPAGNLRISVKDASTVNGKILFNASGNSKDSTIIAIRVA